MSRGLDYPDSDLNFLTGRFQPPITLKHSWKKSGRQFPHGMFRKIWKMKVKRQHDLGNNSLQLVATRNLLWIY